MNQFYTLTRGSTVSWWKWDAEEHWMFTFLRYGNIWSWRMANMMIDPVDPHLRYKIISTVGWICPQVVLSFVKNRHWPTIITYSSLEILGFGHSPSLKDDFPQDFGQLWLPMISWTSKIIKRSCHHFLQRHIKHLWSLWDKSYAARRGNLPCFARFQQQFEYDMIDMIDMIDIGCGQKLLLLVWKSMSPASQNLCHRAAPCRSSCQVVWATKVCWPICGLPPAPETWESWTENYNGWSIDP